MVGEVATLAKDDDEDVESRLAADDELPLAVEGWSRLGPESTVYPLDIACALASIPIRALGVPSTDFFVRAAHEMEPEDELLAEPPGAEEVEAAARAAVAAEGEEDGAPHAEGGGAPSSDPEGGAGILPPPLPTPLCAWLRAAPQGAPPAILLLSPGQFFPTGGATAVGSLMPAPPEDHAL
mmetsp:Transcript_81371/g.161831  ORF Transcript_81371/g.161831 Transcript_81371/m.161831 type:complete len:181 (+) Transcript_81371:723-1265(+)